MSAAGLRPPSVEVHEAETQFSQLLDRVERGEEIVITRQGKPIARLVPAARVMGGRRFGTLRGQVKLGSAFFDPLPNEVAGR